MLLGLLLTLNVLVCLALIGVVLLQRSEGGALGTGSPTGLITTRGAGDLLTRATWILFTLFLTLSLALTLLGGRERSSQAILNRLKKQAVNPDSLVTRAPPPAAGGAGRSNPPPVQIPALPAARAPAPRAASQNPVSQAPVLPSLALPPLGASPERPAAPGKNPAP